MQETKKVKAADDIVFEKAGITIEKGSVIFVESVLENGIILYTEDGERYMIDLDTFEDGFEIAL